LLDVEYKENNPGCKIFPYMAYTPLIPKLFELLLEGEWKQGNLLLKKNDPMVALGKREVDR
jgi:hypothetical protein